MEKHTNPFSDEIDAETAARAYSNAGLARSHFYNPNGISAEWRALGDRLVTFGRGFSAYGDTGYYWNELNKAARGKRLSPHRLGAILSGIRRTIDRGNAFLAEQGAE